MSRSRFLGRMATIAVLCCFCAPRSSDASSPPDDERAVWVFFEPRLGSTGEMREALQRTARALAPAAAERRARVMPNLVDVHDLPVTESYVEGVVATGATLRARSRWLNAVSCNATPEQIEAMAALPFVRRLEPVRRSIPREPHAPASAGDTSETRAKRVWSLDYGLSLATLELMNLPWLHELGYSGAGVNVAMLDTGFHLGHVALAQLSVIGTRDEVGDDPIVDTEPGDPPTSHEHGTQVLSLIASYLPGTLVGPAYASDYLLIRAEQVGLSDPSEEDWWVAGLEWAEGQGADVVSSSLGYWTAYTAEDLDGDTAPSTIAADLAAARGVLVVNAAGNQGGTNFDVIVAPADGDSVLAVGMTDVDGLIHVGSSSGPTFDGRIKPDVVAQGSGVHCVDPNDAQATTTAGGTSMSAPLAAGVAALILERAPFLTPQQVIEALRNTADRADSPDDEYGWGMIDALAAVFHWGPNFTHLPLGDTEDTTGPYPVSAALESEYPLAPASASLFYRVDGGPWQELAMTPAMGTEVFTAIPGVPDGSTVQYYLEAVDLEGLVGRHPLAAPAQLLSFDVRVDDEPPSLAHTALRDQPLGNWPPPVIAQASDNIAMETVTLEFTVNGGVTQGPHLLVKGLGGLYGIAFPVEASTLSVGDVIAYTLTATDASSAHNSTVSGPHAFTLLAGAGQILVIDDGSGGEATTVAGWLTAAGYTVAVKAATLLNDADFDGKGAVVLLSGSNPSALAYSGLRTRVENWVAAGGKLLVEGGESGYNALLYPSFQTNVLHASSWSGDAVGNLVAPGSHALLETPHAVNPPLVLNYSSEADQDAMVPRAEADVVLENADRSGTGGVLAYDDQPLDPSYQILYLCFALSALDDPNQAQALVLNGVANLLEEKMPTGVEPGSATPPLASLRARAMPNPFNAQTVLRLELPRDSFVTVDVYDARGARVRRLLGEGAPFGLGSHDIVWDGCDDAGNDVTSGVYFVRSAAGPAVHATKVAVVK